MAALTTRVASVAIALGASLGAGLVLPVAASAAKAPPAPTVSAVKPESLVPTKSFKFKVSNVAKRSTITVHVPGLPSKNSSYSCKTFSATSCTFTITVPKNTTVPDSSSIDINGFDLNGKAFTRSSYVEFHSPRPVSPGPCVQQYQKSCAPTVLGPTPQSVKVGDSFVLNALRFKPGTPVKVNIPGFPAGERDYSCTIDATQMCRFTISVPDDVHAPGSTSINITGTAQTPGFYTTAQSATSHIIEATSSSGTFRTTKTLQYHTATNPKTIKRLDAEGRYYNTAGNKVPKQTTKGASTQGVVLGATAPTHGLAFTGAEIAGVSLFGLALVGTGGVLVVGARRRRFSRSRTSS